MIFVGGTGNPYFTTDTAAALRAAEIEASALLLAKYGTNGVYDKDPRKNEDAVKYGTVGYDEVIQLGLEVMDLTAVALGKDVNVPIYVFDMQEEGGVLRALLNDTEAGTFIT